MTPGGHRSRVAPGSGGQAMVEFAMVLPLLLVILFISIGVGLIYVVRTAEHKVAYDAARHVAKVDQAKYTGCQDLPQDISVADQVVQYYYTDPNNANVLLKNMTSNWHVTKVSTGPGNDSNPSYYCPQSVQVTIEYDLNVPGWDIVSSLYGAGTQHLKEVGTAARLVYEYDNIPCDQQGDPKDPSCPP